MSYAIESKKLKRLLDFYSPFNSGEELKFLTLFKGQEGLLRYLQTSSFQGIDSTSIQQRCQWFGSNHPGEKPQSESVGQVILSPFTNFCMKIYLVFSIIAIAIGLVMEGQESYCYLGGIFNFAFFVLLILQSLVVKISQNYENAKLKEYMFNGCMVKVWRDNESKQIHSFQLVTGDVVELQEGDVVGADGIVIDGNLTVSEPMSYKQMTPQKCNTKECLRRWGQLQTKLAKFCLEDEEEQKMPSPIILGGSKILHGDGRFVVLCVGKYSRIGHFTQEIYQAAGERHSEWWKKIEALTFELTKYVTLGLIAMLMLYFSKIVAFIIIEKDVVHQNWPKIWLDLGRGVSMILMGLPVLHEIGLIIGMFYIRFNIYQADNIWYKYLKDCGNMKEITAIAFDKVENEMPLRLVKWWNEQLHLIEETNQQIQSDQNSQNSSCGSLSHKFQQMFIQSLKCKDFEPHQVGLKLHSFFIGMNRRFVESLEQCLSAYASARAKQPRNMSKQELSDVKIDESEQSINKEEGQQVELIYIKGNSQTLLKECTHILNPNNGRTITITAERRQKIKQIIYQMNSSQEPSLITAFIEVHPNHPKFREPGYKIVMLSLIAYKENHDNLEFESLAKIKKMGITLALIGNRDHDEAISAGKQMGLILHDKASIQLTGHDFHKIVGGIICKSCKKSTCICDKYEPILKNQDEFNRINKHLNVLSEANSHEKLTLALGFSWAQEQLLFMGTNVNDVPAMRASSISAAVIPQIEDEYVRSAAQIILPDNKLVTLEKLISWSYFYCEFCKKYMVFAVTPCLVVFSSNFICFLLYNTFCVQLLQFVWLNVVLLPVLGLTFAFGTPPGIETKSRKKQNEGLLDRISSRQISSQVITQVCLIVIVLIFGPNFIPEEADQVDDIIGTDWAAKYYTSDKLTICSGYYDNIFNNREQLYTRVLGSYGIYSRHMTFIFNLFVLMQIVNYFNCRSLNNTSHNFLEGMTWSVGVGIVIAMGLHILIMFVGSEVMELYPAGLTLKQWAICVGFSLVVVLVGMMVKQIPYDNEGDEQKGKVWPNRCYNLAVMATMPKESLQDFQIDQELEVKKMAQHTD